MPYRRTSFAEGCFYHVYNRGWLRKRIFFQLQDYRRLLERVSTQIGTQSFELHAYCLMPNHFHFLLKQASNITVTEFMQKLLMSYAKYFNTKYKHKGPVFDDRFKAKEIENDEYLLQVTKYIHRNPLDGGLVKRLLDYQWSSYRSYLSDVGDPFLTTEFILNYFSKSKGRKRDYQQFVEVSFDSGELLSIAGELIDVDG